MAGKVGPVFWSPSGATSEAPSENLLRLLETEHHLHYLIHHQGSLLTCSLPCPWVRFPYGDGAIVHEIPRWSRSPTVQTGSPPLKVRDPLGIVSNSADLRRLDP